MATEKAFDDRRLVDVIALLGSSKASGRLRISDGAMRGAFFFNEGKLVAAHLGPFGGFQAVNLAISLDRPQSSFDPAVPPPSQSNFKIGRERVLLKERYGIDTWNVVPAQKPSPTSNEVPVIPAVTREAPVLELKTPTTLKLVANESSHAANPTFSTLEAIGTNTNRSQFKLKFVPRDLLSYASRRQIFTLWAGLIVIATVSTTAGIASYWRKNPEIRQSTESPRERATDISQPAPAAPLPSQAEEELGATALKTEETSPATRVSPATSPAPLPVKNETRTSAQSAESPTLETVAASSTPEIQPSDPPTKPSTLTIPVVVEITDGHVTEAFIQRPQNGFRAHEATALSLARQRRFPRGTNGKQTITLVVSPEP